MQENCIGVLLSIRQPINLGKLKNENQTVGGMCNSNTFIYSRRQIRDLMAKAFQLWSDHSTLTFIEQKNRKGKVHFDIKFAR